MRTNALVKYQCWTTIKPLLQFYAILYSFVAIVFYLVYNFVPAGGTGSINGIEISCIIYLGITGSLGFNEDFKMAIQNGFTRKQIFIAAMGMFAFVSIFMASVDTLVGILLQGNALKFSSLIQQFLGGENQSLFIQWLALWMVYFMAATFAYFGSLLCNKVGKKRFFIGMIAFGLFFMLVLPLLINIYASEAFMENIVAFIGKWLTFQQGLYPLMIFLGEIVIAVTLCYLVVARTELK